ncbi:hypothetical protein C8R47DRAFT_952517, partial [Mycena vitilis]
PAWLVDCVAQFRTKDLGCHFTSLLAALVDLETAFGFDEETYICLPADFRPDAVNKWIKGGRTTKTKKIPLVKKPAKYADQWYQWWDFLQPQWRRCGPDGNWAAGGDATYGGANEWDALDAPGPNGCLSLVAGLYFWGAVEQPPDVRQRWLVAVQDVAWM